MNGLDALKDIRKRTNGAQTVGLSDEVIQSFLQTDSRLKELIPRAYQEFNRLSEIHPNLIAMPERQLVEKLQEDFLNFYGPQSVNPYVAIDAQGSWIITSHGALLYSTGGYGMLGLGHSPDSILEVLGKKHVMANIMTPSFSHIRLTRALKEAIGSNGECPYQRFLCMNSGSESVAVAARISDARAFTSTGKGGKHQGKKIVLTSLSRGFHGRAGRAARLSDSSMEAYQKHLATFRDRENLRTIEANNIEELEGLFKEAEEKNFFIESLFMEPVMGEGNPGLQLSREFYDTARRLTKEHGSFLVIDSIQAGIRAHGCLSIVDYPGFEGVTPPDMETFSKALNAGQYPMSVLAMSEEAASHYSIGLYGNTMTANPRGAEIGIKVLESVTPKIKANIRDRGIEFLEKLDKLRIESNGAITGVQGTGLLLSAELDPEQYKVIGFGGVEEYIRMNGIVVIHGGENSLRFTPDFEISSEEIDVIIDVVRASLKYARKA